MKKILITLVAILVLGTTTVFGARFSDMSGHWAESVVDEMATKGILNGFEDGTFKPNDSVTREQFAKILVESLNIEEKENNIIFQDVEDGRWSKNYIERASQYLTIGKTNDGRRYFMPTEDAVREEVATAVVKASGLENETPNYDLLKQFSDEDKISEDFRKYIAIAVENGIMQGKGGYFDPQEGLTRAEVSQLIYNVYTKVAIGEVEEHIHETILEYVYKNETQHTVKTVCEICEEKIKTKNETHIFENSKCVCRAEEKVAEEKVIYGDANNDGKVSMVDSALINSYLSGNSTLDKIKFKNADVDLDGEITENDLWLILRRVQGVISKLPHNCTSHTEKYERIDEKKHEKIEICECGEIRIVLSTKRHNFDDGKCVCGAIEGTEYIVLEEYTYANKNNSASKFVEIQIGSGDFAIYQDDDVMINPTPDKIREDEFGNIYAYYDLSDMEQDEEFKICVKRRVTVSTYEEEIPSKINTEILEGFEIYLEPQERIESDYEKIVSKAKELTQNCESDYKKAEAIFEFVNVNMEYDLSEKYANRGSISAIDNMRGSAEEFTTLYVAMCRAVDIPSRVVSGYVISNKEVQNEDTLSFTCWAEIYLKDYGWIPVFPTVIYTVGSERMPYYDSFCQIKEANYIIKELYNFSEAARMMKGVEEINYTIELIEENDINNYEWKKVI